MRVLERVRQHALTAAVVAGTAFGAIVGLFLPIHAAKPPEAAEQAWTLPTAKDVQSYDKSDYQRLRAVSFWGDVASEDGASRRVAWNLQAIVLRPQPRIAFVPVGGAAAKPTWLPIGGKLPDGSILVAVDADAAHLEREGCRYSRRLFATADEKKSDACADASPRTDTARAPARPQSPGSGKAGTPTRQEQPVDSP